MRHDRAAKLGVRRRGWNAIMSITDDPECRALLHYSAAIGRDRSLVQGAGGNVSLKRDGVLWVKASGTWLAHAEKRPILVPVQLDALLAAVHAADGSVPEDTERFVAQELNAAGLRPSTETTLHAALPHRVVVHVHCVETIAWAVQQDAAALLAPRLAGMRWAFIPYIRPGAPLTRRILERTAADTEVLVLGKHGLVVGGATTAAAAALLAEVQRRLRRPARDLPPPRLADLLRQDTPADYAPAEDAGTHAVATDPLSLAVARLGSFYPDHVVFLGPGIVERLDDPPPGRKPPPMLVAPGVGVLLRRDATAGAIAMARCLADVMARLDPAERLTPFTAAEEAELLGWDAEHYRQKLDRS
jgi:rhamnose utilization protein RhaD (predicted bifunctional aldolase and dehydrogenase)